MDSEDRWRLLGRTFDITGSVSEWATFKDRILNPQLILKLFFLNIFCILQPINGHKTLVFMFLHCI